jgi:hypothetical protein
MKAENSLLPDLPRLNVRETSFTFPAHGGRKPRNRLKPRKSVTTLRPCRRLRSIAKVSRVLILAAPMRGYYGRFTISAFIPLKNLREHQQANCNSATA